MAPKAPVSVFGYVRDRRRPGVVSARASEPNNPSLGPLLRCPDRPETHLIPLVLDAASERRADVAVFGTDYPTADGTAVRDYVHVSDLADAHVQALKYLLEQGETLAINLGAGRGASVREVIDTARRITGRKIVARNVSRREGDPPNLVADPKRAGEVLSWAARRSDLATIITDAWRWHKKRFGQ